MMQAARLQAISSMATRRILDAMAERWQQQHPIRLSIEAVGGVDAARRVTAGEPFDLVFLADDPLQQLVRSGHVIEDSVTPLMASGVSVAVPSGTAHPPMRNAEDLRSAVLTADSVGVSTGPSGVALLRLFESWGLSAASGGRLRQAPAGVPVATFLARGEVALGFQQTSELSGMPGIEIVGPLPDEVAIVTLFSGGVACNARQPGPAREVLSYLASRACIDLVRAGGMTPADGAARPVAGPGAAPSPTDLAPP